MAGVTAAAAADLKMPVKAPPPVAAVVYNWTGFYIGLNAGYSWGRATTDGTLSGSQNVSVFRTADGSLISSVTTALAPIGFNIARTNVNGFVGGGQAGYNWQIDRSWLLGLEADFQGSAERGSATGCSVVNCPAGSTFLTVEDRLRWFGTVRARGGWLATDRILLYATGGLAYGQLNTSFIAGLNGLGNIAAVSSSTTRVGWTVGGGIEGALDPHWTLRLEYLYIDLGRFTNGAGTAAFAVNQLNVPNQGLNTVTTTTINAAVSTRFTDNVLRAAVNYRF
jgi:outer membrane immunogenic protein